MRTTDDGHASTQWGNDASTLPLRPRRKTQRSARPSPWGGLKRISRRRGVVVILTYVGGNEPWVRVEARGATGYVVIGNSVDELLRRVCNEPRWLPDD